MQQEDRKAEECFIDWVAPELIYGIGKEEGEEKSKLEGNERII